MTAIKTKEISFEEVDGLLRYNPLTGECRWKRSIGAALKGKRAGCITNKGYRRIQINGLGYAEHRLAWLLAHKKMPTGALDHINGDVQDNRILNLRETNHSLNGKNQKKSKRNKSGFCGVVWHKNVKKWIAQVSVNKKRIYLGSFNDFEDAKQARIKFNKANGYTDRHGT